MDEDGDPVAWNAPSLSASDMGGDLLTWGAFYENPSEANGTIIVSGVGSTPSVFNYIHVENFYGTDIFVVTVSDGIYEQNVEVRVVITSQPDEGEPLVRMMPGFGHSILYANAEQGQPITVWGAVSDGEAPLLIPWIVGMAPCSMELFLIQNLLVVITLTQLPVSNGQSLRLPMLLGIRAVRKLLSAFFFLPK